MRRLAAKDLDIEIGKILMDYTKEVRDKVEKIADEVANEAVEELKSTSPKRYGNYAAGWDVKKENRTRIVHNARHGSLTHLLEYGHSTRNGGRTRAISHIAPVEKKVIKNFEDKIRKEVEAIG